MKVVAIIAEFNPFHKGHKYIIEKAKELSGADTVIVIMSGSYVQRGEVSFVDKYTKTEVALKMGADMIIELPMPFACSSAEYFASTAVNILNGLGCVDFLAFGVENGFEKIEDLGRLDEIVDVLVSETDEFKENLKLKIASGLSYATARAETLAQLFGEIDSEILKKPNNILAIEYLKALKRCNSRIQIVPIKRVNAGYHEIFDIDEKNENSLYSATNIRNISNDLLRDMLKEICCEYEKNFNRYYPIRQGEVASFVIGTLLVKEVMANDKNVYFDVPDYLYNKIKNNISKYTDFTSFVMMLKSKEIAYSAISRSIMHIALGYTDEWVKKLISHNYGGFIRCLGVSDTGAKLFGMIDREVTVIMNLKNYKTQLDEDGVKIFKKNLEAENVYHLIQMMQYGDKVPNEFEYKFVRVAGPK